MIDNDRHTKSNFAVLRISGSREESVVLRIFTYKDDELF